MGTSLVRSLRQLSYGVVAKARSIDKIDVVNASGVVAVAGDVAIAAAAARIVRSAQERFGQIDAMVNNAGVFISEADFAALTKGGPNAVIRALAIEYPNAAFDPVYPGKVVGGLIADLRRPLVEGRSRRLPASG